MTGLEYALARIASALRAGGRGFALVGGLAVSVRATPRMTRDADLVVTVSDDADAEQLIMFLRERGYIPMTIVEQEYTGRLSTVRLAHPDDPGLVTDLLFASSGIESEIVQGAEELLVTPSLTVPVASVGHLIAMKLLARDDRNRPADADDLRALAAEADEQDWRSAQIAVSLITARGFDRERDLQASLALLRTKGAY